MAQKPKKELWLVLLLVILAAPIVFVKLDGFSMRTWDESIYAVNTYEMMQRGEWIVPYFNGHPDLSNNKPPLAIWAQMASASIVGFSPLAMRLPSALSALATVIIIFLFGRKMVNGYFGLIAAGITLTALGFISMHTGRTGDTDALMALFVTLANFQFIKLLEQEDPKPLDIYLVFFFLALGLWTKSVFALIFVPGFIVSAIVFGKAKELISNKHVWIGMLGSALALFGFILLRGSAQDGFIQHFMSKDAGRLFETVDQHRQGFLYYAYEWLNGRFSYWLPFFTVGAIWIAISGKDNYPKWLSASLILFASAWLVISFSATKLTWYDMSLYPIMALLSAFVVLQIMDRIPKAAFKPVFLGGLFFLPYMRSVSQSQDNYFTIYEMRREAKEMLLHEMIAEGDDLNGFKIYEPEVINSVLFYQYWLNDRGTTVDLVRESEPVFNSGDRVILLEDHLGVLKNNTWRTERTAYNVYIVTIE